MRTSPDLVLDALVPEPGQRRRRPVIMADNDLAADQKNLIARKSVQIQCSRSKKYIKKTIIYMGVERFEYYLHGKRMILFFSQTFCFFMSFARLSYLEIKELHLKCI